MKNYSFGITQRVFEELNLEEWKPIILNVQVAFPKSPTPKGDGKNINQGLTPSDEVRKVSVPSGFNYWVAIEKYSFKIGHRLEQGRSPAIPGNITKTPFHIWLLGNF